jgi:outer membrane receptor for ferrienterochelin and colicins
MQGFDGDHVLVLLDSQPLISPAGAAVDLDQISVLDIERIEVLRGAASVLYGSLSLQQIDDPGFDYNPASIAQSSPSTDKRFVNLGLSKAFADLTLALKSRYFSDDKYKILSVLPGQTGNLNYISEVEQWQQDISLSQNQLWKLQGRYVQHKETSGNANGLRDASIKLAELDSQYQ